MYKIGKMAIRIVGSSYFRAAWATLNVIGMAATAADAYCAIKRIQAAMEDDPDEDKTNRKKAKT